MLEFTLRLAEAAPFRAALAAESDYSEEVMRAAHARLLDEKLGEYGVAARLETLIAQVQDPPPPKSNPSVCFCVAAHLETLISQLKDHYPDYV